MGAIHPQTAKAKKKDAQADFVEAKAEAAMAEIDADLGILNNAPTNAQVIAVLKRTLARQKKGIRLLARLAD